MNSMKRLQLRKSMRGVTLMELMIVVVIVAIMAALAYPQYRQFAARAKRNEAKAALLQIATNQERWYLSNNCYTPNLADLGVTTPTGSGSYAISLNNVTCNNYTGQADYLLGGEEATKCNQFQIDGRNNKTSGPLLDCWTRTR